MLTENEEKRFFNKILVLTSYVQKKFNILLKYILFCFRNNIHSHSFAFLMKNIHTKKCLYSGTLTNFGYR